MPQIKLKAHLTDLQKRMLQNLSENRGISVNELITRVVGEWLDKDIVYSLEETELPKEFNKLSPQGRRALKFHGVDTLEKVSKLTKTGFMRLERAGSKIIEDLEVLLDSHGLKPVDRETYRRKKRLGKLKP